MDTTQLSIPGGTDARPIAHSQHMLAELDRDIEPEARLRLHVYSAEGAYDGSGTVHARARPLRSMRKRYHLKLLDG